MPKIIGTYIFIHFFLSRTYLKERSTLQGAVIKLLVLTNQFRPSIYVHCFIVQELTYLYVYLFFI